MRILHLYSDWRWTGPAEPVLQMCRSLEECGHEVLLAYRAAPHDAPETVGKKAAEYGVHGTEQLALDRYFGVRNALHDIRAIPRLLARERFDVMHMHLSHDHAFGGACARLLGRRRPALVRTLHRRSVLRRTLGYRAQLGACTDAFLVFTDRFRDAYIARFGIEPERIGVQPMTIDLERFRADREFADMRAQFGVAADAPLIGIVGRFQKYRKMDVFLDAAREVLAAEPRTRFLIIGKSSQEQETVVKPAEQLGIREQVVMAGYRMADYDDTLACLDVFSLLMPGFDGTARAVREAMALGKPCVVSDYGMLPEIVEHGRAGLVVPMRPDALAAAWLRLIREPQTRRQMGARAREHAEARFDIDRVGPCLETFYQRVLALRG